MYKEWRMGERIGDEKWRGRQDIGNEGGESRGIKPIQDSLTCQTQIASSKEIIKE